MVVRVGDTVRRNSGPWTPAVHALLEALRTQGIDCVPAALGMDPQGREILSFLPGDVVQYPLPPWIWHPSILQEAAALLRRIHDASSELARASLTWQLPTHHPVEVICHNDFAPYNMVFRNQRFAGVFDFDAASPGPRIWDFAYLAYQLVPLIEGLGDGKGDGATNDDCGQQGAGAPSSSQKIACLDTLIEAYGYPFERRDVLETLSDRLGELAEYSDNRAAETGRPELNDHAAMYRRDSARMLLLAAQQ